MGEHGQNSRMGLFALIVLLAVVLSLIFSMLVYESHPQVLQFPRASHSVLNEK